MNGGVGFVALLEKGQSQIVLRICFIRSNSDRLLTMDDRFRNAPLSQQEISEVRVGQMILGRVCDGLFPERLAVFPITRLNTGNPGQAENYYYAAIAKVARP